MAIAKNPSKLSLPQTNPGVTTVLEFLVIKFPSITAEVWRQRMTQGKVHWHDGSLIDANSAFIPQQRVYYYREVEAEPLIPFREKVIFHDDTVLVAYKPHFLPVTPGGKYVEECLQNRLRKSTGIESLQAVHRIDKGTAGLVLFSVNPETRRQYHQLFETHQVFKTYQAVASIKHKAVADGQEWEIKNRIEKSEPRFLMRIVSGVENSHSCIRCVKQNAEKALFELNPVTGKTHQLRLHMQSIGWPLLNDNYYPNLQASQPDDFSKPLQLLAQQLRFIDPITQQERRFTSGTELSL
jgi:tRNA pseudouridine32 synthase / 23S rRNA pseudouridine746 synthase